MKLKLFIITLIAISFAVTGLLGGCGGKKKNTADEPRDDTICAEVFHGGAMTDSSKNKWGYTNDGKSVCAGYSTDNNLIWLAVCRDMPDGCISVDTLYVLSIPGNSQLLQCYDIALDHKIDFTATSSKSNIAKLTQLDSETWSTTSYNTTGESTINIKTADGRKTWFKVKVVDDMNDAPTFTTGTGL